MASKLTSRQLAQLAWLEALPPKLDRLVKIIELMAIQQADDSQVRGAARLTDELKGQSGALSLMTLAEGFGFMGSMLRRTGSVQTRVRGLRELLSGIRANAEGARRSASTALPQQDKDRTS